jgi:iron complex transport system substrate-binding protein
VNPRDLLNGAVLGLAIVASLAGVALVGRGGAPPSAPAAAVEQPALAILPDGRRALRDARGALVALGAPRRIVSLSLPSDALLAELAEPERVVAFSSFSTGAYAYKLGARPRLAGLDDLEAIAALHPDLVLCTTIGSEAGRLERLRAAGLAVFDLGDQVGIATLVADARAIGILLGASERGERYATGLRRRMAAVAATLPPERRRRAVYVSVYGEALSGGTVGSSYHDVLTAAGLVDAAAQRYRGWPQYRIEELIALDPQVIVTARGMGDRLRRLPGLEVLAALRRADGIIELDGALLDDPGPAMLDAAEALFAAAYPDALPAP